MTPIPMTALKMAERFIGVKEAAGNASNPMILAMLQLDNTWPQGDEVPWCSAFANWVCWLLDLPRSKSLLARSWLTVGRPVSTQEAAPGFDVVVLKRGRGNQPDASNLTAPGHVGFLYSRRPGLIRIVGGNQQDAVTVESFTPDRVLGVRRLVS